jgi:ketosteroid isomerase-like protein
MATENTSETGARFYDAWNTGNVDLLDQVCAPDVLYHLPPMPDADLAGLKQMILATLMSDPDFKVWEDEQTTEGATTCSRWTCSSTFTGVNPLLPGVEPTGKQQTTSGATITHWKDGKAVEIWHFGDMLGMLQQQGVLPPLG